MNNDFILVLGVIFGAFTFPALVSAFSSSRPPRGAAIFFIVGGGLISLAIYNQPNTYSVDGFPEVALRVFANLFR